MSKLKIILFVFAIFFIFGISSRSAFAASYTASQTGNWSSSSTWGGAGVPGSGDTASIGAFTVTVDTNTTVGTSPNDTTTAVISLTNAASVLKVASGVTLTVKGNRGAVNSSKFQQEAGSTVTFDNSGSGGSPVYRDINGGFTQYVFNGSSGSVATIQAISGQTFLLNGNWSLFTATYAAFVRGGAFNIANISGNVNISDSTFTSCGVMTLSSNSTTADMIIDRTYFTSGTGAGDLTISVSGASSSGTRRLSGNRFGLLVTYNGAHGLFTIYSNYFGYSISSVSSSIWTMFRNNFVYGDGTANAGGGQIFVGPTQRNYFVIGGASGNPHFISAQANAASTVYEQNIFESQAPDLVDVGDSILVSSGATVGSNTITGQNNLVLPSGLAGGTGVAGGTLLTLFSNSTSITNWLHNTVNVNNSTVGGLGKRGAFAIAEGNTGGAGQVAVLKINIAWGGSSSQGYLGERISGNVKDIITVAGADYNWAYNTSAGNNQLAYADHVTNNTLWTAGDAVAAGVDSHQGTSNPQFIDSTRNVIKWVVSRGYGTTFADGLVALQADPTRVDDLTNYVFAGFIPTNLTLKGKAHDGGDPGAVPISVFNSPGGNISTSLTTSFSGGMAY